MQFCAASAVFFTAHVSALLVTGNRTPSTREATANATVLHTYFRITQFSHTLRLATISHCATQHFYGHYAVPTQQASTQEEGGTGTHMNAYTHNCAKLVHFTLAKKRTSGIRCPPANTRTYVGRARRKASGGPFPVTCAHRDTSMN